MLFYFFYHAITLSALLEYLCNLSYATIGYIDQFYFIFYDYTFSKT